MTVKSVMFAVIGSLVFLSGAQAQSKAASTQAAAASAQTAASATTAAVVQSGSSLAADGASAITPGWYYMHATQCYTYIVGSTTYLYVFSQEGGYVWTTVPLHQ